MASLFIGGKFQAIGPIGIVPGAKLYTYAATSLTPLATYTNQGGGSSNTNPVVCDANGQANVWLGAAAYRMILKNASDVTIWDVDNITASPTASEVAITDAGGYLLATSVEGALQELANQDGRFQVDGVNVLKYIAPAKWANIIAGTSTDDLASELQAALSAEPSLVFPDGLFNTGTKLMPRADAKVRGINRHGAKINATSAITIFEAQAGNSDWVLENLRFMGAGATGIATASTAGSLQGYLVSPHIRSCDFDYDLAYGIDSDLLFAVIEKCTFGWYGVADAPDPGTSDFVGVRSVVYPATSNYVNLNVMRDCRFHNAGNTAQAGVQLTGGYSWRFENNSFEQGGLAIDARDLHLLQLAGGNWFEANVNASGALIRLDGGTATSRTTVESCHFTNNTVARIFQITTGFAPSMRISDNVFGLNGSGLILYDNATTFSYLPADGSISFYDNEVTGGASTQITSTDFRGGPTSLRATVLVDTTGPTIIYRSHPNVQATKNATGDVTLSNFSFPLATGDTKVRVQVTPEGATECRTLTKSTTAVRVQAFDSASAPYEATLSVDIYGS